MACIGEHYDGESCERRDGALPFQDADMAAVLKGVAFDEVEKHEYDEVADGNKGNDGGVLERVEAAQERKGYYYQPAYAVSIGPIKL